jgi:hypothetical protein
VDLSRGESFGFLGFGIVREWNLDVWSAFLPWTMGWAHTLSGRASEGVALLQQSLTAQDTLRIQNWHPLILVRLGEALLAADRPADARDHGERALTLARQRSERGHEAYALWLLSEISLRNDPGIGKADTGLRTALTLATELGMRPLAAHCHLGIGKLYRHTGYRSQAQEHLSIATGMYREMAMTHWLERAVAEMSQLG